MEKTVETESHLSSAAAFVEGGIQEACDDACSICLDSFCHTDPSTVTGCKHEFHLQCILEWCQRSSQCPMCWQHISLKDPISQELLEAVEKERNLGLNHSRNATVFRHPAFGDFAFPHFSMGANDAELEEHIIQHLAAATTMGRARYVARRNGHHRLGGEGHPQFIIFSANPDAPPASSVPASDQREWENDSSSFTAAASPSIPYMVEEARLHVPAMYSTIPSSPSYSSVTSANRNSASHSTPCSLDGAGPSDFQSFSESLKSRFNAVSVRYKESIAKSTRGWKERFFSRGTSVAELGSEVRREINSGINTVSRMKEQLDTRENSKDGARNMLLNIEGNSVAESSNPRADEAPFESDTNQSAPVPATSVFT